MFAGTFACSNEAPYTPPPSPPPDGGAIDPAQAAAIAAYCSGLDALDRAWCGYAERCCSIDDRDDVHFVMPGCRNGATFVADCEKTLGDLVAARNVSLDGAYVRACLDATGFPSPPETCSGTRATQTLADVRVPYPEQIPACRSLFRGARGPGEKCDYAIQCREGLRCRETALGALDFSCRAIAKTGEACVFAGDCADAMTCLRHIEASPADVSTCAPIGDVGDPCGGTDQDCRAGLACGISLEDGGARWQCTVPGKSGEACGAGEKCVPLATCDARSKTCLGLLDDGAPCDSSYVCKGRCDARSKTCVSICGGTF